MTGAIALVFLLFVLGGADPVTVTYSWLIGVGTIGLLVLLMTTSAAVIVFFARTRADTRLWHTKLAPGLAFIGLGIVVYLALSNYAFIGGATDPRALWLVGLIPVCAIAGWALATIRQRRGSNMDYAADLGA